MNSNFPMSLPEWSAAVGDLCTHYFPAGGAAAIYGVTGGAVVLGLLLLLAGGRFLPGMMLLGSAAALGAAGALLAGAVGLPTWPTVAVGAAGGLLLGWLMLDIWLSALLGGGLALAGLAIYSAFDLAGPLSKYTSDGYDAQSGLVTLPLSGGDAAAAQSGAVDAMKAELGKLLTYLDQQVPQMRVRASTIAIAGIVAGFVVGLLLPRFSRAVLAATSGVLLLVPGGMLLAHQVAPGSTHALASLGAWNWAGLAILWLGAVALNMRGKRRVVGAPAVPVAAPSA